MIKTKKAIFRTLMLCSLLYACEKENEVVSTENTEEGSTETETIAEEYPAIATAFGNTIDPDNLAEYSNQTIPNYINEDNTRNNQITDAGATLGRVLFYDVNLSSNNTISCSSCHVQSAAFGDLNTASTGVNGTTGRHSTRLVNARFAEEERFFWDERAATLEAQTTMPIQDHIEMGFSGQNGDQGINDLIDKLEAIGYYEELFTIAYGDAEITETRMQNALAQFVRSIQSFDSKYDVGRAQVNNNNQDFPNFTDQENLGKDLFNQRPQFANNGIRVGGGAGCNACHRAPEFDIDPDSDNNGAVGVLGTPGATDFTITRSPSLRDMFNAAGELNGPMMHDGSLATMEAVIDHYDAIPNVAGNNNLDRRLRQGGAPQRLQLSDDEKDALVAFMKTLSGTQMYTDEKWSDPFE